ncbi:MAG: PQQ-like beta-propeller repeat protein [Planctomycetes bacterium]|nr:PQQ-like beta-propeller repeat protein [Planctomycetota bacterium]
MPRLLIIAVLVTFAAPARADNWPQWRGPRNDGHSAEKGLPTEWSAEKNVAWKLKLPGRGSSTPAVWGNDIFITSLDGDDTLLMCVGTDGKEKWKASLGAAGKAGRGDEGNAASASCSTDGKHVWTFAGNGNLVCYTVTGKEVWTKNLQDYGKFGIQFGCHWTPVLYKDALYLQVMHRNAQIVVAFEAATGKELWKQNRPGYGKGESPDTYSSPFIWVGQGGPLLVAHGNDYCTGHKLDTGEEVWRVQGLNPTTNGAWRFVSSPLVLPDLIVVPSCKSGPTVAFNPVGAKGNIDPDNKAELWRFKSTPDVVSPIRVGDIVYLSADGPFTAVNAKTGEQLYRQNLSGGKHRANMIAADGKIYVTSTTGAIDVVQAGNTFKKLATNTLPDTLYATPAPSGGRLYVRGWNYLWAIGTK